MKMKEPTDLRNWGRDRLTSIFWTFLIALFTIIAVSTISFGTIFEYFSNPVLGIFGLRVGLTPSILGVSTLWGIGSAWLAYTIAEIFRDLIQLLFQEIANQPNDVISERQIKIVGNLFIAIIVVPIAILILTAVAAAQIQTVEVLWDVLMVGYSGAIIGAFSEIISNVVP